MLRHKTIMKSKTIFLVLLSVGLVLATVGVFFRPVHAQTWVEGHITQDTTWTFVDSPYRAINDVIVDPGVLLTVEPGVEVQFADGFSLIVNGSLNAVGTDADPVVFTSNRSSPSPGAWNTIEFRGNESEHFTLRHATVKYAEYGVAVWGMGEAVIEKSEISNCSRSGIMLGQSNVVLRENTIKLNGGSGISCVTPRGIYSDITIVNNLIHSNQGDGISLRSSDSHAPARGRIYNVTVSGNNVSSNREYGMYLSSYSGLPGDYTAISYIYNVTISDNTISSNGRDAIYLWSMSSGWAYIHDVTVSGNNVSSNDGDGIRLVSSFPFGRIYNVTVSENRLLTNNRTGIWAEASQTSDLSILKNIISANNWDGAYIRGPITTNFTGNSISYSEYGILYDKTTNNFAKHNDIHHNSYGMNVTSGATVNAEYNYWGHPTGPYHPSLNPEGAGNSVNGNGTDLDFIPFLTTPINNEHPVADLKVDETTVDVNQNVTFNASDSTDDSRIDYYFFDFGDGTNSSWTPLSVVTHKYASEGTYNATLIVMDDLGFTSLDGDLVHTEITVVPEFPSFIILPLFMIATLLIVIVYRRKQAMKLSLEQTIKERVKCITCTFQGFYIF